MQICFGFNLSFLSDVASPVFFACLFFFSQELDIVLWIQSFNSICACVRAFTVAGGSRTVNVCSWKDNVPYDKYDDTWCFFCFFCFDLFCLDFFIQQLDEILKSGLVTAAVSFWGIKSPLDFLVMPASKHNWFFLLMVWIEKDEKNSKMGEIGYC